MTNAAARALADGMLRMLGGGTLQIFIVTPNDDGTAAELGYAASTPETIEIGTAHGSRIETEQARRWEILVSADDAEDAAHHFGIQDVHTLFTKCRQITFAGVALSPVQLEAVCAGGDVYLYRVIAAEAE
jgi:nucleoside 2-deoxyribosyltransferase